MRSPKVGRIREGEPSTTAGMTDDVLDVRTDRAGHRVHDPGAEAGPLRRRTGAPPDSIVFDDQFGLTRGKALQADSDFARIIWIGLFERICHQFRDNHTQIDAHVRLKLERVEVVPQRRTMTLLPHRCLDVVEQA